MSKKHNRKMKKEMKRVIRQTNKQLQEWMNEKKNNTQTPMALQMSMGTPFEKDVQDLYDNLMFAAYQYTEFENINNMLQKQAKQIIQDFKQKCPHYNQDILHDEIHLFFTENECLILNKAIDSQQEMDKLHQQLISLRESALFAVKTQFEMVKHQHPENTQMQSLAENLSISCQQMIKELI